MERRRWTQNSDYDRDRCHHHPCGPRPAPSPARSVPGPLRPRPAPSPAPLGSPGQVSARLCASVFPSAKSAQGAPSVRTQGVCERGISAWRRSDAAKPGRPRGGDAPACASGWHVLTQGRGAEVATRVPCPHRQAQPAREPAETEGSTPHPGVTGLQLAPWPRARGAAGWPRAARDISGPPSQPAARPAPLPPAGCGQEVTDGQSR